MMRANQLCLWFASMAHVLVESLRCIGLPGTELTDATCGTIRVLRFERHGAVMEFGQSFEPSGGAHNQL